MKIRMHAMFFVLAILPFHLMAENDPDVLLKSSMDHVKRNEFDQANSLALQAIKMDSTRYDLYVHMANLQAWQHQYDSSKFYIKKAYALNPKSQELYDTWLNVLLWGKNYVELLTIGDLALKNGYRDQYNLLLKKAEAYQNLGQYPKALEIINLPENITFLDSSKVSAMRQDLIMLTQHRSLSVNYSADMVNTTGSEVQHLVGIDVSERFKNTYALLRANYARRFGQDGFQLESDVYQRFRNKSYLYLNAGVGFNQSVFPTFRAGAEYTFPFLKTFEGSIGTRYLNFPNRPVVLLTGQLAKYMHSWWIGIRPFYTLKSSGNALTTLLDIRKYEKKPKNFSEIELGYGSSPDERLLLESGGQYFGLNAWKIKLSGNRMVWRTNEIRMSLSYNREEQTVGLYRNRFVIEWMYKFRIQ